nr:MAG TPA: hypothetical protein [Inoviridae sp.]
MTKINDIITDADDSVYADTAIWCNENNAFLEEIEPEGEVRRFKVVPVPEPTESELRTARIAELQKYLNDTDWYAVRFAETGAEIPDDIKEERRAAREEISSLREENEAA